MRSEFEQQSSIQYCHVLDTHRTINWPHKMSRQFSTQKQLLPKILVHALLSQHLVKFTFQFAVLSDCKFFMHSWKKNMIISTAIIFDVDNFNPVFQSALFSFYERNCRFFFQIFICFPLKRK